MTNVKETKKQSQVKADGLMTFDKDEKDLWILDFQSNEYTDIVPFCSQFKVQGMRGGNVYLTELAKRIRNKPIFRMDNSSLSKGRNKKYYFVFTLPEEEVAELPEKLVCQANEAAMRLAGAEVAKPMDVNKQERMLETQDARLNVWLSKKRHQLVVKKTVNLLETPDYSTEISNLEAELRRCLLINRTSVQSASRVR